MAGARPQDRCLRGIPTKRDIVARALAEQHDALGARARHRDLEPVTCGHGDDLGQAITLMRRHRVQRLPLLDEGEAVGVILLAAIVFALPDEHRGALDEPDQR